MLARRQLGSRLRRAREASGRSREDVASSRVFSVTKILRMEGGLVSIRPGDIRELAPLYDLDATTVDAMCELARATKGTGWWEEYGDVVRPGFGLFVELEATASAIRIYRDSVIPGLVAIQLGCGASS